MSAAAGIPVRIVNYSGGRFRGWLRRGIDACAGWPKHESGEVGGVRYVIGRELGNAGCVVDLHVDLQASESIEVDLAQAQPWDLKAPPPIESKASIGGVPFVAGDGEWVRADGAALLVHVRARFTPMLVADLWVPAYGGQPWAVGELIITASNPSVPDVTATVPANLRLEVEGAVVLVPGQAPGAPLLPAGEIIGDGQAKSFPVLIAWTDQFAEDGVDWSSAAAALSLGVGGVARSSIGPLGFAEAPARFDPLAWGRQHFAGAIARLHSWDAGPLGVAASSGVSGDQEDQGAPPACEALLPRGTGCENIRYAVALGFSRRPCHHLRVDGSHFEPDEHPNAMFWDGRADTRGRDWMGKSRALVPQFDAHGWWGPDRQHWWLNTLLSAYELTGSPALQWQIQAQAKLYLAQWTVRPGIATTGTDAPRATCMEGLFTTWLYRCLEDRELAERVKARAIARMKQLIVPAYTKTTEVAAWQVLSDPRVINDVGGGFRQGVQWYHQAIAVFGLDVMGHHFGVPEARQCALAGALAVVNHAYTFRNGLPIEWDVTGYNADGSPLRPDQFDQGKGAARTGWFRHAWFPLASATVLRNDPTHERARIIYDQLRREALLGNAPLDWFAPVPAVPVAADTVEAPR